MITGSVLGLFIGALLGLTGAGGGILAVPALMFGLGMDLRQAAPVALVAVGMAAATGAVQGLRQGAVRYKAAALMAILGGVTAPLGVALAQRLPSGLLSGLFAVIMLLVAWRMIRQSRPRASVAPSDDEREKACRISPRTGRFVWSRKVAATLGSIGAFSGICTGMLGVGGGFIIVPALDHFSELRMHSIVPTSLMVIALVSAATVGIAAAHGLSLPPAAWGFVAAAVVGMGVGRGLAPRLSPFILQRGFATLCIVVAAVLMLRAAG